MSLVPRWCFMTEEAKARTKRTAVSAGVVLWSCWSFGHFCLGCSWQWLGGRSGERPASRCLLSLDLATRIVTELDCVIEDLLEVVED